MFEGARDVWGLSDAMVPVTDASSRSPTCELLRCTAAPSAWEAADVTGRWHGIGVVVAAGLLIPACSVGADDAGAAQSVTTAITTPLNLAGALHAAGLGCDRVVQSNVPAGGFEGEDEAETMVESATCNISGEPTVLNVQENGAAQRTYLEHAPEILCSAATSAGRDEAVMVTGEWWSARPESIDTANLIADAIGGVVHTWSC